jgi:D-alanyl-D-alanine carboxypeptidase (penicillin-binding protein 5/6)
MQNETFAQIVQQQQYLVRWVDGRRLSVRNTNRLLREYPGAIGVKTGTTNEAGQCLIAVAEKEGKRILVVVLKSKNRFYDAVVLLDYGLSVESKSGILNKRAQLEYGQLSASA